MQENVKQRQQIGHTLSDTIVTFAATFKENDEDQKIKGNR